MDISEKWNRIVGLVEKYKTAREEALQSIWETFVFGEFFGYETNEIESQRSIKIGSTERIIPDIIIKNENKDLFIVELKQHTLNIGKEQLLSYFKQLKLNIGILVNSKISIFVYDYEKDDSEQKYIEIDFVKDNLDGIKFIELFTKGNFSNEKIVNFVNSKYESKANGQKIKQELESDNFVKTLVFNYFKEKYQEEEIEEILKDYEIKVIKINSAVNQSKKLSVVNSPKQDPFIFFNTKPNVGKVSKNQAIQILKNDGISVYGQITFSSENSSVYKYWANPSIEYINNDWWLILNDIDNRTLFAFFIPANSIQEYEVVVRADKPELIDIQINYDDDSFTDSRSKIEFKQWFVKSVDY